MWALGLTLLSFAIILVLSRFKVPLWGAILAGAFALGLFFKTPLPGLFLMAWDGLAKSTSVGLLITMVLLLMLSDAMRVTGRLEQIVSLAQAFLRRPAVTLAVLPALIGLLPMPGGALFSAPMVRQAAHGNEVDGDSLSALNYWWRHIWEHWWPLYPGVLLAMTLTGTDMLTFAALQIPMGLCMAVAGILLYKGMPDSLFTRLPRPPPEVARKILVAIMPILMVMGVWLVAGGVLKVWLVRWGMVEAVEGWGSFLHKFAGLILGLVVSLVYTLWPAAGSRFPVRTMAKLALNKQMLPLLGLVMSVMVYQGVLEHVHAAAAISRELAAYHVPVTVVVVVLPFIAGMLTGVAFGFVGVSFPLVISLVTALPDHPSLWPYVVLAYASGHLGMMATPLHLCYVVSNQYFQASFRRTFLKLLRPLAVMTVCATAYFLLLRRLM